MRSDSSDDFEFVPKIANSTEEEISHARAANVAMTLEKAAQKHTGLSGIPEGTFDGLADEVVDAIYKRIIKANSPSVEDNVTPTPGR